MHRSVTDLSLNLSSAVHQQTFEIHKEQVYIRELEIRQLERKLALVMVISDGRVLIYEGIERFSERERELFRFKIIERQVLRRPYEGSAEETSQSLIKLTPDQNQMIIIDPKNPVMAFERRGRIYFHRLRPNLGIASITSFRQSKTSKEQVFLYINQKSSSLNIMKIPLVFDPRASPECVDDYLIKQMIFEGKCVKKATIFSESPDHRYLVMALFSHSKHPLEQQEE